MMGPLAWWRATPGSTALGFCPLIAGGVAQPFRLRIQHRIQRVFHAAAHNVLEIVADPIVIDLDDLAQFLRAILAHGGFPLRPLIRLATTSLAGPRGPPPLTQIRERFCTSSAELV